jgi:type I restriction enzyme, S subunit
MPVERGDLLKNYIQRIVGGGTPSRSVSKFWDGNIPWASVKDFSDDMFQLRDTQEHISDYGVASSATNVIPANIPIICTRMAVGRTAITIRPTAINQDVKALFPSQNLDSAFLTRLLRFKRPELEAVAIGSTVKGITLSSLLSLRWSPLPLPEQRRIAEVLDTLDAVTERTEALVQKLRLARAGLLHDLLTRGLDEQGQLRDPERNLEAFRESELGRVPREWAINSISDIADNIPGSSTIGPFGSNLTASDYRSVGVPVIFVRDVKETGFVWKSEVYLDSQKSRSLQAHSVKTGDFIATKMGTPPCLGCVYPEWMPPGIITADIIRVTVNKSLVSSHWLALYVNSAPVRKQVGWISGGVTRVKVTLRDFRSIQVALPSLKEQQAILAAAEQCDARITAEQLQLDKLRQLKRGLMEDLLTGRVRVGVEAEVEDSNTCAVVLPDPISLPAMPDMPPPVPAAAQRHAMYRASPGANPAAQNAWVEQLRAAVAGQQVGTYSPAALDALLPELAALTLAPEGVLRVPKLLARVGIRFMLLAHPAGSRTSGAAFYLDEPARTQPVVALSLLRPYLDVFWFNLLHELGHIRLGHTPVHDEELGGKNAVDSPDEQATNAFARQVLIPEELWRPFLAAGLHDSNRIRRFARKRGRHHGVVAGRLGTDTGEWSKFNSPELRPQIRHLLDRLAANVKP